MNEGERVRIKYTTKSKQNERHKRLLIKIQPTTNGILSLQLYYYCTIKSSNKILDAVAMGKWCSGGPLCSGGGGGCGEGGDGVHRDVPKVRTTHMHIRRERHTHALTAIGRDVW